VINNQRNKTNMILTHISLKKCVRFPGRVKQLVELGTETTKKEGSDGKVVDEKLESAYFCQKPQCR